MSNSNIADFMARLEARTGMQARRLRLVGDAETWGLGSDSGVLIVGSAHGSHGMPALSIVESGYADHVKGKDCESLAAYAAMWTSVRIDRDFGVPFAEHRYGEESDFEEGLAVLQDLGPYRAIMRSDGDVTIEHCGKALVFSPRRGRICDASGLCKRVAEGTPKQFAAAVAGFADAVSLESDD